MLGVYLVDMRYLHKDQSVVEINQIDKENNNHAGESWCSYSAPVGGTDVCMYNIMDKKEVFGKAMS